MRGWLFFAAINGFLAVLAAALGAHTLRGQLTAEAAGWLATAERYQMWHALALGLVVVLATQSKTSRFLHASAACFAVGLVLFCGSLYLLAFTGWRTAAMAVPVGGVAFLGGWLALAAHALKR